VYRHVRQTSRKSRGRSMTNASVRLESQVTVQCVLYGLAFMNTYIWSLIILGVTTSVGRYDLVEFLFPLLVLSLIFYPMQGLFNFCIFIRTRYLQVREAYADSGRWRAFWIVMTKHEDFYSSSSFASKSRLRSVESKQHTNPAQNEAPTASVSSGTRG